MSKNNNINNNFLDVSSDSESEIDLNEYLQNETTSEEIEEELEKTQISENEQILKNKKILEELNEDSIEDEESNTNNIELNNIKGEKILKNNQLNNFFDSESNIKSEKDINYNIEENIIEDINYNIEDINYNIKNDNIDNYDDETNDDDETTDDEIDIKTTDDEETNDDETNDETNDDETNDDETNDDETEDDYDLHNDNLQLEGKILNEYNIISELGRGSYSIVWLGYNINDTKYYAIKVQNPNDYNNGLEENKFMKQLPNTLDTFNHLIKDFIIIENNNKFLCSVYELHCGNLDGIIRKGNYNNGFPITIVLDMIKQILESVNYLHNKLKVFHSDIKTDNILLRGINKRDENIIDKYTQYYKNKDAHSDIIEKLNIDNKLKFLFDDKYLNPCKISLADFGSFVKKGEFYDESYGTRYYRSPENILIGQISYANDIWSIGCTFYELLIGEILFDPEKDNTYDRDFYHLKLINELCGPFPLDFLKTTQNWKHYFNNTGKLQFNKNLNFHNKFDDLKDKYKDYKYIDDIIDLLKKMLEIDSAKRINSKTCLDYLYKIINKN